MPIATASLSRRAALGLGIAGLALRGRAAPAQPTTLPPGAWPERPVRLINSGGPGSGIDLIARLLGEGLGQRLGQPFAVENRPGAESMLAAEAQARAQPGEALLVGASSILSTVPLLHERLPYSPADLTPVTATGMEFLCLAVPAALPVASLEEFVGHARARPGTLSWFSVPGFTQLAFRLFQHEHGLDMAYVAYRGSPPAVLDLAAGRIQVAVLPLTPALGAIREGRIRALAVTSRQRAPFLPEAPTTSEAGFPDFQTEAIIALYGWRGMPDGLRDHLAAEAGTVLREPAVAERLRRGGIIPVPGTAAEIAAVIAGQRARAEAAVQLFGPHPPG